MILHLPGISRLGQLWSSLKTFFRDDFDARTYGYTAIFLVVSCSVNYYFRFDDHYLEPMTGSWEGKLSYFLFYAVAWYGVAIPVQIFSGEKGLLRNSAFWGHSALLIAFIGIEGGMGLGGEWISAIDLGKSDFWARKTFRQWQSILLWIPVYGMFMRIFLPRFKDGLLGIRWRIEDIKPYLAMLWIMVPLIFMASFLPDFQAQYPIFKRVIPYLPGDSNATRYMALGFYEIAYLLSFIMVELMFRGGLVLGMAQTMGRQVVLPMVSVYMFLHFGKPLGESIGSVFGGYILAVLAFQNRNIWGGIFIHGCVALLMDVAAAIQIGEKLFE